MQDVNIYIETDILPMRRTRGRVIYILETVTTKGPATITKLIEMEEATQNRITAEALEEALSRIHKPCRIRIHTDCGYVRNAINNRWICRWMENGWKNSKGEAVCDSAVWQSIEGLLTPHEFAALPNKESSYQSWMQAELERAAKEDLFWGDE